MARLDKGALTRLSIISEASKQFLEKGYSETTISSIAQALEISKGNLTFHYPTKEHLLEDLVDILYRFNWKQMEKETNEDISSLLALCLELTALAGACEDDEKIKDLLISAYTSPLCLAVIRRNDAARAKKIFHTYCPDWTDDQYAEAEILVSGIEYATLMTAGPSVSLKTRIAGAIHHILGIYGVPEEIRHTKLKKAFSMDYRNIGKKAIEDFKQYVGNCHEQMFHELLNL